MKNWKLSLTTWNSRALFHFDPNMRDKKLRTLRRLLVPGSILAVQESHGSEMEIQEVFYHYQKEVLAAPSFCPSSQAGGV
eukprot:2082795-Pyramimonas_sp.AAC.1